MEGRLGKRQRSEGGASHHQNEQNTSPLANCPAIPGSSQQDPIDLTAESAVPTAQAFQRSAGRSASTPNCSQSQTQTTPVRKRKAPSGDSSSPKEKRLRVYRARPPQSFHSIYARALSQRFYVLTRAPDVAQDGTPMERFEITGSTGNIYTVEIKRQPCCNCPHALQGNQCKHVIFILSKVLQAPFELTYQLAFLSSELEDIFAKAPVVKPPEESESGKRKPIEGDCPICFCELDTKDPESVVWCKAACGQNFHQECFERWAGTRATNVTCPLCRSKWEGNAESVSKVEKTRGVLSDGYVNVADQLGIDQTRDHSSYSRWGGYGYGRRRRPWY